MRITRRQLTQLGRLTRVVADSVRQSRAGRPLDPAPGRVRRPAPDEITTPDAATGFSYAPHQDGRPDPGEVVWAWVPYEEDASQGKDRPALLVGRSGDRLLALPLTSKDHDRDAGQEARAGRHWMDVGSGAWDTQRRPSEVRLDRLLHLAVSDVRREGAALPRATFDAVVEAARPFLP